MYIYIYVQFSFINIGHIIVNIFAVIVLCLCLMHIVCTEFYEIHGFQDFSIVVKVLYLLVSRRTSCLFLVTMTEITALQAGEGHNEDVGLTWGYMIFFVDMLM